MGFACCAPWVCLSVPLLLLVQTLENTRERDVTMVEEGDEDVQLDEADDEFAGETFLDAGQHSHFLWCPFHTSCGAFVTPAEAF
jgi:hypothetical protein